MSDNPYPNIPCLLDVSPEITEGESIIVDNRAAILPSESVQQNLLRLVGDSPTAISWLQSLRTVRR